jgi:hypothetical protein
MSKKFESNKFGATAKRPLVGRIQSATLATVLTALAQNEDLSPTRRRDLISAVKRVADLLSQEPAAIPVDMPAISAGLAAVNPVALGITPKRFANICKC